MLSEEVKSELKKKFDALPSEVDVLYFQSEDGCEFCRHGEELAKELSQISPSKVKVRIYSLEKDKKTALEYGINMAPAFVLHGKEKRFVRFFGIPAGLEFSTMVADIRDIAKGAPEIPKAFADKIKAIDFPVEMKVFITLTCPYCPQMVKMAHDFAILNPNIKADMIEANEFPELSAKYNISSVPKLIINDVIDMLGVRPPDQVLNQIMTLKK